MDCKVRFEKPHSGDWASLRNRRNERNCAHNSIFSTCPDLVDNSLSFLDQMVLQRSRLLQLISASRQIQTAFSQITVIHLSFEHFFHKLIRSRHCKTSSQFRFEIHIKGRTRVLLNLMFYCLIFQNYYKFDSPLQYSN